MSHRRVFFEPWGLGDSLIAAAIAREKPGENLLACQAKWHGLLRAALESTGHSDLPLLEAEVPYADRTRRGKWALFGIKPLQTQFQISEALSIRGDFRDYLAARRFFPKARTRVTGWDGFFRRRIAPLDRVSLSLKREVQNRYAAWAELAGVPISQIEASYRSIRAQNHEVHQKSQNAKKTITIHLGAQWISRQYPHVADLKKELELAGYSVTVLAGPQDPLPQAISETEVLRPSISDLISELKKSTIVLANDSGPMHLAAFLGCRVIALARISQIQEWLPPLAEFLATHAMPRGYVPDAHYQSDSRVSAWPEPQEILEKIRNQPSGS